MHIRQSCDSWVITFASSLFRWSHILSVSYSPLVLFSQDAITFPFLYLLYKLCKGVCNGPCSLQIPETEYICVCICEKGPYPTLWKHVLQRCVLLQPLVQSECKDAYFHDHKCYLTLFIEEVEVWATPWEIYLVEFMALIFSLCKIFNVAKTHISGLQGAPDFLHGLQWIEG